MEVYTYANSPVTLGIESSGSQAWHEMIGSGPQASRQFSGFSHDSGQGREKSGLTYCFTHDNSGPRTRDARG